MGAHPPNSSEHGSSEHGSSEHGSSEHGSSELRWALVRRSARRLLGSALRGRIGIHPWVDDWQNFWNALLDRRRARAHCPLCGYRGLFLTFAGRPRQVCMACGSRARHRTLALAIERWQQRHPFRFERGLHLAPEACLAPLLGAHCQKLLTGDLEPGVGGIALDLRSLPLADASLDLVFASHVLEHIVEDRQALAEVRRVLRPGGLAILVVPITAPKTIEFGEALAEKNHHARECGPDYFARYQEAGFDVETIRSDEFEELENAALTTEVDGVRTIHHIPFCLVPTMEGTGEKQP